VEFYEVCRTDFAMVHLQSKMLQNISYHHDVVTAS